MGWRERPTLAELNEEARQAEHDRQAVIARCGRSNSPAEAKACWAALARTSVAALEAQERAALARADEQDGDR